MSPGGYIPHPKHAWTIVNINVDLQYVADLTDVSTQKVFDTNAQELTGDWRGYQLRSSKLGSVTAPTGTAPTQEIGDSLYAVQKAYDDGVTKLEGFLTLSAKMPDYKNLVIFPDNLQPGSFVTYTDAATGKIHYLK